MSSIYSGKTGNISTLSNNLIASSTNASPIVLQLSTPVTSAIDGTRGRVAGHHANTAANGIWQLAFVDATHVALVGSTGNGVGGFTGNLQPYTLGAFTLIDDSAVPTASMFNVPPEFDADAAAFVSEGIGGYKVVSQFVIGLGVDGNANCFAVWDHFATPLTAGTGAYVDLAGATVWTITGPPFVMAGDILSFEAKFNTSFSNGSGVILPLNLSLWLSEVPPGAASSFALVANSGSVVQVTGGTPTFPCASTVLNGQWGVVNSGADLVLKLRANTTQATINGAGAALNMIGDYQIVITILRQTQMPQ